MVAPPARQGESRPHSAREIHFGFDLTDWIAFLTLAVAGGAGLIGISSILQRWVAFAILLILGGMRVRFWLSPERSNRRLAYVYLLASLLLISTLLVLSSISYFIPVMFFVWSVDAMLLLPMPQALCWIAAFSLAAGANFVVRDGWVSGIQNALLYLCGYLFMGVFSHSLYRARAAQAKSDALLAELRRANRQLQAYAAQVETLVASEERNRLAREMHDTVGHHLTVAAVQLEAAERLIPENPAKAAQITATGRAEVRAALAEIRHTVSRLRTPLEAELPLPAALRQMALDFQQATGTPVHLNIQEIVGDISQAQHLALYRAAQEALTNIQRHAGASQAWLSLQDTGEHLCLTVRDDGGGLTHDLEGDSSPGGGFGLLGMQERAAQLGGEVRLAAAFNVDGLQSGAELTFSLPWKEDHDRTNPHPAGG